MRADAAGASVEAAVAGAKAALAAFDLPPDYDIGLGGQAQMMVEMRTSLAALYLMPVVYVLFARRDSRGGKQGGKQDSADAPAPASA